MLMKIETEVCKKVLAIYGLKVVCHMYKTITATIKQSDMGKNAEKHDFCLLPVMLLILLKESTIFEEVLSF